MTFKDKEKEISEFIDNYCLGYRILESLCFSEIKVFEQKEYIICILDGKEELVFFTELDHVRCAFENVCETKDKYEIKFIYDFIEYLESLGFGEGE